MFDRPLVAFDIETIPDPDAGRREHGLAGSDLEVVHEMVRLRLEETEGSTGYPQLPWHRVVCVCATVLDPQSGEVEIRHLGGDPLDERSHIEGFYRLVGEDLPSPRIVSWNGGGFDLPVLRYRAMVHGVAAPGFYGSSGYQHRQDEEHIDVMDVLSGYGAAMRAGLGTMSELLGIPNKGFLEREIYDHVLGGEMDRVIEYCKLDTVDTMLVFLVWAYHVGHLGKPELVAMIDGVRTAIAQQPFEGWREIGTSLEKWPAWARPASE